MKKTQFVIILSIEIIAGLIGIGLLLSDLGICSYLLGIIIFTLVLYPFFKRLNKENDELQKKKIRRNMLLVMLIPSVIAIITIAYVVVALLNYYI